VAAAPDSLRAIADRVERRLRALLDDETRRWDALDAELAAPFASLARLVLGGGKRLRPAFCHWAFVGAGGHPDDPVVVDAGAAFELLHAFALLHDDVMDGSHTRRGDTTAHLDYAGRHAAAGWRGEARRFGEGVAILVGDLAFVYADMLVAGIGPDATRVWNELRLELNVGQYLDMVGMASRCTEPARADRIARYKSGKYTVERPLHLGAALAGRLDDLTGPLSAYGLPLGDAFQLRDDMLGTFGDASVTGKPVGDDLREGKPTPLLALASSRAGSADAGLLARIGSPDLDDAEVEALQALIERTGARAELEDRIATLAAEAIAAIEAAPVLPVARHHLVELAEYVAHRDH